MSEKEYIEVVTEYADMVYRIAFHHCANREDAEDIMQNVFVKLYRRDGGFVDREACKHWLIRVTVNECNSLFRSFWRSKKQELEEYQWEQLPAEHSQEENKLYEQCSALYQSVMSLSAKYRVCIFLYYYEGYNVKEIADILQCRETTVQTRLMRARQKLKEKMQGGFGDD